MGSACIYKLSWENYRTIMLTNLLSKAPLSLTDFLYNDKFFEGSKMIIHIYSLIYILLLYIVIERIIDLCFSLDCALGIQKTRPSRVTCWSLKSCQSCRSPDCHYRRDLSFNHETDECGDKYLLLNFSFTFLSSQGLLRANVCNFRESVDSREFLNFFIFCPHNLYSTLISKIAVKLVTAFYFFLNRAKFEKRQIGALSSMKLAKIKHFLRART